MWKVSVRLKAGMKIIKITRTNVIKWPLGLTPQYEVSGSWRVGRGNSGWKVQELHPDKK